LQPFPLLAPCDFYRLENEKSQNIGRIRQVGIGQQKGYQRKKERQAEKKGRTMSFETWTEQLSKVFFPQRSTLPKELMWRFEIVDEDLEESE
jgi:hypothetical protein